MSTSDQGAIIALEEARISLAQEGIPVGSAIISPDGKVLGRGHNQRIQNGSHILHGETAAIDSARSLNLKDFAQSTLYTTLSPCPMCAGAMILIGIKKVVIGENAHMTGREDFLRSQGIEVVVLDDQDCKDVLDEFIRRWPEKWEF